MQKQCSQQRLRQRRRSPLAAPPPHPHLLSQAPPSCSRPCRQGVFDDNIYCHVTSGLGAGLFAVICGSPVDVVKSRMMGEAGRPAGRPAGGGCLGDCVTA